MPVGLTGCNLVGQSASRIGNRSFRAIQSESTLIIDPVFACACAQEVDSAVHKATLAFPLLQGKSSNELGRFLQEIKNELELNEAIILARYQLESGLNSERAKTEFLRTCLQIDQYIDLVNESAWKDPSIDTVNKEIVGFYDIRKLNVGIGPVVVFGASNFPLAYSTAGTDTISALAAGCPVIVKAHPFHPGTSELVAQCICNAIDKSDFPDGTFSHLFDDGFQIAELLVKDSRIKAVGFTGSQSGGKALFNLAMNRPDPIPFFAEMGSTNPIVVFPELLGGNMVEWSDMIVQSVTNDAGQFCTKPGLIFCLNSPETDKFINTLLKGISAKRHVGMIHPVLRANFEEKLVLKKEKLSGSQYAEQLDILESVALRCTSKEFISDVNLQEEVFGPFALIVTAESIDELNECLKQLEGQLTASVLGSLSELKRHTETLQLLSAKVGRMIINGVPTGVRVCPSMHHGGPYPASTDSRFGSVGVDAIKRFVRPQSFQNWPDELLPPELQNDNPLKLIRRIDGKWTFAEIKP